MEHTPGFFRIEMYRNDPYVTLANRRISMARDNCYVCARVLDLMQKWPTPSIRYQNKANKNLETARATLIQATQHVSKFLAYQSELKKIQVANCIRDMDQLIDQIHDHAAQYYR